MAKHAKKHSFFRSKKHNNVNSNININLSDGIKGDVDKDLRGSVNKVADNLERVNLISRKASNTKKESCKYIAVIVIFLILAILSWSWLFLLNPNISSRAEPYLIKYFPNFEKVVDKIKSNWYTMLVSFGIVKLDSSRNTNQVIADLSESGIVSSESSKIPKDKNSASANNTANNSKADKDLNKPTLKLTIYEGPSFNKEKQTYYFKVKAVVSGNPTPTVQFSRDDSKGALGPYDTLINFRSNEKSYVLTAVASNKNGIAMDSITLTRGGNSSPIISEIKLSSDIIYINNKYEITVTASDPDKDSLTYKWTVSGGILESDNQLNVKWITPSNPDNYDVKVEVTDSKGAKTTKAISVYVGASQTTQTIADNTSNVSTSATTSSATSSDATTSSTTSTTSTSTSPKTSIITLQKKTEEGGFIEYGGQTYAGGNIYAGDSPTNKPCAGFLSFDISNLGGKNVNNAVLVFSFGSVYGNPLEYADAFWINIVSWGPRAITQSDFTLMGVAVQSFATPSVTCAAEKLKTELQKAINSGKSRFQIRVHFSGPYTDNDDNRDGWEYLQNNVNLTIEVQ